MLSPVHTIEKRFMSMFAFLLMIMYAWTAVSSNLLKVSEFYSTRTMTQKFNITSHTMAHARLTLFPITYSKSGVRTNGALSLFMPCRERTTLTFLSQPVQRHANLLTMIYFLLPRKWPKSMWKRLPDLVTITLSLWRSPMP